MLFTFLKINSLKLVFFITFLGVLLPSQAVSKSCPGGKKVLFFEFDSTFDAYTNPGFLNSFVGMLEKPLQEIGYCLTRLEPSVFLDLSKKDYMVMFFRIEVPPLEEENKDVLVSINLVKVMDLASAKEIPYENALVQLSFDPAELSTFEAVLIKKIIENLRMHYVCHLRIQSSPSGVTLKTDSGLEGVTPLEWILPVGDLQIRGQYKGYEPIYQTIDINGPGNHTYFLQMRKKQFYNSPWIYPSIGLGLTAAAAFIFCKYFDSEYDALGPEAFNNYQELFFEKYKRAKIFEAIGIASTISSGVCLSFSFIF